MAAITNHEMQDRAGPIARVKRVLNSSLEWMLPRKRPRTTAILPTSSRAAAVPSSSILAWPVNEGDPVIENPTIPGRLASEKLFRCVEAVVKSDRDWRFAKGELEKFEKSYRMNLNIQANDDGQSARFCKLEKPDEQEEKQIDARRTAQKTTIPYLQEQLVICQREIAEALVAKTSSFSNLYKAAQLELDPEHALVEPGVPLPEGLFSLLQIALDVQGAVDDHKTVVRDLQRSVISLGHDISTSVAGTKTQDLRLLRQQRMKELQQAKADQTYHMDNRLAREERILKLARPALLKLRGKIIEPRSGSQVSRGDDHKELNDDFLARDRARTPKLREDLLHAIAEAEKLVTRCRARYKTLGLSYDKDLTRYLQVKPGEESVRTAADFERTFYLDRRGATQDITKAEEHLDRLRKIAKERDVLLMEDKTSDFGTSVCDGCVDSEGVNATRVHHNRVSRDREKMEQYCDQIAASGPFLDPFELPDPPNFEFDLEWHGAEARFADSDCLTNNEGWLPENKRLLRAYEQVRRDLREHMEDVYGARAAIEDEAPNPSKMSSLWRWFW